MAALDPQLVVFIHLPFTHIPSDNLRVYQDNAHTERAEGPDGDRVTEAPAQLTLHSQMRNRKVKVLSHIPETSWEHGSHLDECHFVV